jgi:hypothetical protein
VARSEGFPAAFCAGWQTPADASARVIAKAIEIVTAREVFDNFILILHFGLVLFSQLSRLRSPAFPVLNNETSVCMKWGEPSILLAITMYLLQC